jgi:hypothetical protein
MTECSLKLTECSLIVVFPVVAGDGGSGSDTENGKNSLLPFASVMLANCSLNVSLNVP